MLLNSWGGSRQTAWGDLFISHLGTTVIKSGKNQRVEYRKPWLIPKWSLWKLEIAKDKKPLTFLLWEECGHNSEGKQIAITENYKLSWKVKYFKNTFSKNKNQQTSENTGARTEIPNHCWERLCNVVSKPFLRTTGSSSLLALPKRDLITGHSTPDAAMGRFYPRFLRLGSMACPTLGQCLLYF